jgi:hypothetical protein
MVRTKEAKSYAAFKCTLGSPDNVNVCDWKLCHIADVGLNTPIPLSNWRWIG